MKKKNNVESKKILVADDDPAIVDALQFMLEENGYQVITTVDGATVGVMFEAQPDLLLLDIWMSGQDGRDICKALKAQKTTKKIPIIMISANKDTEKIAKLAGANDFLLKPFEMDDLLTKIKNHLYPKLN
jgi:DNA-binding response OmpR family regulator